MLFCLTSSIVTIMLTTVIGSQTLRRYVNMGHNKLLSKFTNVFSDEDGLCQQRGTDVHIPLNCQNLEHRHQIKFKSRERQWYTPKTLVC